MAKHKASRFSQINFNREFFKEEIRPAQPDDEALKRRRRIEELEEENRLKHEFDL